MNTLWRRAFGLRLLDRNGRLVVPWGWMLVGLMLTAATVAYDLSESPFPRWQTQAAAVAAARRVMGLLPDRASRMQVDPALPVAFMVDRYADAYANRLAAGRRGVPLPDALPIWTWRVPLVGGRGYVAVNAATGTVVSMDLRPAQAAAAGSDSAGAGGGTATLDEATALARLAGVDLGWDGPSVSPGPGSMVYTWRSRVTVLGEAREMAEVTVRSGRATGLRRYVAVPTAFRQDLDAQEQRGNWVANRLLGWVEVIGMLAALALAVAWRRQAHWGFGVGVAAIFLGLAILGGLNSSLIGQTLQMPHLSPGAVVALVVALVVTSQIVRVAWLVFGGAAGWALAREQWGDRVALLTGGLQRLLSRDGAVAGLRAYALFVVHYQVAFWFYYFAEKRLGIWEATGLAFSQKLNLTLPLLYPLQVVILAPIMEEVLWRLFAIASLRRLFRLTFPAVLLPAALWGLAHSWYQVYPPYTRAIELTLVGVLLGYAFIAWGLEVTIGSHLLYNALVTCVSLAVVPLPGQRAGAILAAALLLLPAVPIAAQLWRQRPEPAG